MNVSLAHTHVFSMGWRGRKERQLYRFFGLSLLLHILSALLFAVFADQMMNRCHEEVFYIDLNQSSLPIASSGEEKPKQAAKKPRQAPVPAKAVQSVNAPAQPMQQTVFSETAKPVPAINTEPVSAPVQGNPGPPAAGTAGSQSRVSASSGASGGLATCEDPVGDVTFGSASGPSFMQRVLPIYPMVARRFNREGKVVLRLTIDAVGSLLSVEVLQDPGYGFASAAVEAVRKSRFHPARHGGRPFTAKAILPIRFTLQGVI